MEADVLPISIKLVFIVKPKLLTVRRTLGRILCTLQTSVMCIKKLQ